MGIISNFAQSYYSYSDSYYTTSNGTGADAEAVLYILISLLFFALILTAATYVFTSICLMQIFKKAGVKPWIAWVPFYNAWKLLEIGGQRGFWAILTIVPIVNYASAVFIYIAMYHIGKKLGKEGIFVLWAIFLPVVWLVWLAVDKSKWHDKASSAPSLHRAR